MFYSYEILARKRGKFGVIWCAATHKKSLSKREYASVNIIKACHDIEDYICVRVPAGRGSRPRFSLYLSSQLMYGTLTVYHKQVDYLFNEAKDFIEKLSLTIASDLSLDLDPKHRCDVTLPDPVDRYNPDLDWEFDLDDIRLDMLQPVEMFTPTLRRQMRHRQEQDSPLRPDRTGTSPDRSFMAGDLGLGFIGSPHTRPSDELQITEEARTRPRRDVLEPVPENDLPEMDINSFLNDIPPETGLYHPEPEENATQPDQPTREDDSTKKDKAAKQDEPASAKKDEPAKKDKSPEIDQRTSVDEPIDLEQLRADLNITPSPDAQIPAEPAAPAASPEARKRPLVEEETPRSPRQKSPQRKASKKSLDFSESPVPPAPPRQPRIRRKRRGNLLIDKETVVSKTRQLQGMKDCSDILRQQEDVFQHPQQRPTSAQDLLRRPGIPWCNRLMPYWKKGAKSVKAPIEDEPVTYPVEPLPACLPGTPQDELQTAADITTGVIEQLQEDAEKQLQDAVNVPTGAEDVPPGVSEQQSATATITAEAFGVTLSPIPSDQRREPTPPHDQLQPDMSLNFENQSMEVLRERASQDASSLLGNISDMVNLEDSLAAGRSRLDLSRDGSLTNTSMRSGKRSRLRGPDSPTQLPLVPEAETPGDMPGMPGMTSLPASFDQEASMRLPGQKDGGKHDKPDRNQSFIIEKDSWSPFEIEDNTALKIRLQAAKLEFKRRIDGYMSQHGVATFRSICPPHGNSRSTAAMYFGFLLGDASAPNVKLVPEQEEPYGEIVISKGPMYRGLE